MRGTRERPESGLVAKYKEIVGSATLTDADVRAYCRAYSALRQQGPSILQQITDNPEGGLAGFEQIERTLQASGFTDYASFVKTNAKVAWAWNVYQATNGYDRFHRMQAEGLALLDQHLNDPEVPAVVKDSLRLARQTLQENWARNSPWAQLVIERIRPLTSEADMAVIRRNEALLLEVFTGYPPTMFDSYFDLPQQ